MCYYRFWWECKNAENFNTALPRIRAICISFKTFLKLCAISELGRCANSELSDSFSELLKPRAVLPSVPGRTRENQKKQANLEH